MASEGWATQYALLLGIEPTSERMLLDNVAAGLQLGLPQGWTRQVDDENRCYFWNELTAESDWFHPDHDIFTTVIDLHRQSIAAPDPERLLQQAVNDLEAQRAVALEHWMGPYFAEGGAPYWYDAQNGVSVWQDPRIEMARCHALRSGLVSSLLNEARKKKVATAALAHSDTDYCPPALRRFLELPPQGILSSPTKHLPIASAPTAIHGENGAANTVQVAAITSIQGFARLYIARAKLERLRLHFHGAVPEVPGRHSREAAARAIQGAWRTCIARRRRERHLLLMKRKAAATSVQRVWRGYAARRLLKKIASEEKRKRKRERRARKTKAVTNIQRVWRGVMAKKVCRSLREQREQKLRATSSQSRASESRRPRAVSKAAECQEQKREEPAQMISKASAAESEAGRQHAALTIQVWWQRKRKHRVEHTASIAPAVDQDPVGESKQQRLKTEEDLSVQDFRDSDIWNSWGGLAPNEGKRVGTPADSRKQGRRRQVPDGEKGQRCSTTNIASTAFGKRSESHGRLPSLRDARPVPSAIYTFDALDACLLEMDSLVASPQHRPGSRAKLSPTASPAFKTPSPAARYGDHSSFRSAGATSATTTSLRSAGLQLSHSTPSLQPVRRGSEICFSPPKHDAPARPTSRPVGMPMVGSPDRVRRRSKRSRAASSFDKHPRSESFGALPGDDAQPLDADPLNLSLSSLGSKFMMKPLNNWLS